MSLSFLVTAQGVKTDVGTWSFGRPVREMFNCFAFYIESTDISNSDIHFTAYSYEGNLVDIIIAKPDIVTGWNFVFFTPISSPDVVFVGMELGLGIGYDYQVLGFNLGQLVNADDSEQQLLEPDGGVTTSLPEPSEVEKIDLTRDSTTKLIIYAVLIVIIVVIAGLLIYSLSKKEGKN